MELGVHSVLGGLFLYQARGLKRPWSPGAFLSLGDLEGPLAGAGREGLEVGGWAEETLGAPAG